MLSILDLLFPWRIIRTYQSALALIYAIHHESTGNVAAWKVGSTCRAFLFSHDFGNCLIDPAEEQRWMEWTTEIRHMLTTAD